MKRVLMLVVSLVVVFMNSCSGSGGGNAGEKPPSTPAKTAATQYELEVVFTGPWTFVKDSVGKRIVAVAPLIDKHGSLYLRSIGSLPVPTGKYDLKLSGAKPE